MSVAETEAQLAEVELLLQESPGDETLTNLQRDLVELIELTKTEPVAEINHRECATGHRESIALDHIESAPDHTESVPDHRESTPDHDHIESASKVMASVANENLSNTPRTLSIPVAKKKSGPSDAGILTSKFELPSHLLPLPSDTEAERAKKKRTAKALKSKFRSRQKTAETAKKQKSWKNFMTKGKGKKSGGKSIFATEDGITARVGVIGRTVAGEAGQETKKRLRHEI